MEHRFDKCNKCEYREIVENQHILMLGMSDANNLIFQDYCEEQYEDIKYMLERYMLLVEPYLKDSIDKSQDECKICKSKERVEKSKEYIDKMVKVVNSERYYYEEKLQRIYFLQDDYFEDCGSF